MAASKSFHRIIWGVVLSIFAAVLVYGRFVEPDMVCVREVNLSDAYSDTALVGKTVVLLSDLHLSRFNQREEKILRMVEAIAPDLILLTGDYVVWRDGYDAALEFLKQLKAKYGVFAVMGDYDYSDSRKSCLFCHRKDSGEFTRAHSVQFLRNVDHEVVIGNKTLNISGIDGKSSDFNKVSVLVKENFNLVLSHSPMNFDRYPDNTNILMVSGDTHGGQIRMPVWIFRLVGYQKNAAYNYGLFKKGKKALYVTSGLGFSHFKFRLFCPPEIVVFKF